MPRLSQPLLIPSFVLLSHGLPAAEPTADDPLRVESQAENAFAVGRSGSAAKLDLDPRDDPQSRTALSRELLDTRGAWTLREALRSAPGVTMAAGEGGRTGDSLSIRGFAANSDLYLDGLKDNGQYFRDTFATERVEVLRGAAGVLAGRGATGGLVNTITRKPSDQWTGEAAITGGVQDFFRVTGGAGGPLVDGVLGGRIDGVVQDSGSFRDEQHLRRYGVAPSLSIKANERTTVLVQGFFQDDEGTMDYGIPMYRGRPAEVPVETYYGFADDSFQDYRVAQATFTVEHRITDRLTIRNATRGADYQRLYRTEILQAVNYAANTVARAQAYRRNHQQNVLNQTELGWNGQLGEREAKWLVGADYARESYDFWSKDSTGVPAVSVFNPQSPSSVGSGRADDLEGTLNARTQADTITNAVYALGMIEAVSNVKLVAGIRIDHFTARTSSGPTTTPVVTQFTSSDTSLSPRAGVVWTVHPLVTTYANFSRSSNPSAETFSLSAATADLDPEETDNYEVGIKSATDDESVSVGVALFRLEKRKARTVDPTNTAVQVLDGKQRTDGIETELGTTIGHWSLQGATALMRPVVVKSNNTATTWDGRTVNIEGKRPANAPVASGSLWAGYDLGHGFTIGTGFYAVSRRYGDAANSVIVPGYLRLDATIGWSDDTWSVQLNAQNLADTVHYETGSARSAYAGTPLNAQLTVGARF